MYDIVLYEDARGVCPVGDFLDELNQAGDKRSRQLLKKIYYAVEILKQNGTRSGENFTKHINGDVWELRTDDHRVFFFLWNGNHIVLLHTFRKKTQKTPPLEIEAAEREMSDWINRHGH